MKRKADIYFVLYLTAIVSFFVVENQVKEYKHSTNKLINRLAFREKLVSIQNASAMVSRDTVNAELTLTGDFVEEDFDGKISFIRKVDSVEVRMVPLMRKSGEKNRFIVRIPNAKKVFGERDTFYLVASLNVKPLITDKVREKWRKDLDGKTAAELEKRIASVGNQELVETIQETFNVVLNDIKVMPDLPFVISSPTSSINVLQGLEWSTQLAISGVPSPEEYDIEILKGEQEYGLKIRKELVKVFVDGVAKGSGEVRLRAKNRLNGKTSDVSLNINIRTPRFVVQNPIRAFVGDSYSFDGRLESIDEENMNVSVRGLLEKDVHGAVLQDLPLKQSGTLVFSVFINGKKIAPLDFTVTVDEPPPPEIKYVSYKNHNVTVEVHSYGKVNGEPNTGRISMFISGARNATKVNERVIGFTTVTTYELTLKPPREGNRVRLELKAKDARQKESKTFIQEFQFE